MEHHDVSKWAATDSGHVTGYGANRTPLAHPRRTTRCRPRVSSDEVRPTDHENSLLELAEVVTEPGVSPGLPIPLTDIKFDPVEVGWISPTTSASLSAGRRPRSSTFSSSTQDTPRRALLHGTWFEKDHTDVAGQSLLDHAQFVVVADQGPRDGEDLGLSRARLHVGEKTEVVSSFACRCESLFDQA